MATLKTLFTHQAIQKRIQELGQQITQDYKKLEQPLVLIGVLKGSFIFMADLCRAIEVPLETDFITLSSYKNQKESSGEVHLIQGLSSSITNKQVLILEDIVDTGNTIEFLLHHLSQFHPKQVRVCAFLEKSARRLKAVPVHYTGFRIQDHFVYGYGLDRAGLDRNLSEVVYLE